MTVDEQIRARLAVLQPTLVELVDESHLHAGHAGAREGGCHCQLKVVSERFCGKSAIERHRMIYSALGEMVRREIHAIKIKAFTPEEMLTLNNTRIK
jgi:BolA protein